MDDPKSRQMFEREVQILGTVRHPALLTLHGCTRFVADLLHSPAILTPFMSNGSLDTILKQEREGRTPSEWTRTRKHIILLGIASGMMFMHEHRLIHRDLKPANVLLDDRFEPKIADFGLSKFVEPGQTLYQSIPSGTALFMAPEIFSDEPYDFKVDVYAFGILMYTIRTSFIVVYRLGEEAFVQSVDLIIFKEYQLRVCPTELIAPTKESSHPEKPAGPPPIEVLERMADGGDAFAQIQFGQRLQSGEGIEQSLSRAAYYFNLAADSGNATGMVE
jgi:serine/threonine protein kinase